MSFKLEIVRGGRWHTKLSNFFSADVYSDKQIGRSTHRDLVMWGSERCIIAEKETLKRGEVGVPACPARDTPLDHPSKSGCWGTSAFPSECFGSGCFLGHGHFLLGRAKMEKHGRLEGPWDTEQSRMKTTPLLHWTRSSDSGNGISALSPFALTQHHWNVSIAPTGLFNSAALSAQSLSPRKEIPNLLSITACIHSALAFQQTWTRRQFCFTKAILNENM